MSIFKLPLKLCIELNSLVAKFGWKNSLENDGIQWWLWEKLCNLKQKEDLDSDPWKYFNQALLVE